MKHKLLYFLFNQKINQRNIDRFYLNEFKKKKIKIKVINFFNQKKIINNNFQYLNFKDNKIKIIKDAISEKPNYYIDITNMTLIEILFQRILFFLNSRRVKIDIGLIPIQNTRYNLLKYLLKKKNYLKFFLKFIDRIFYKIFLKVFLPKIKKSFVSGKMGSNIAQKRKDEIIVKAHNLDYDIYLKEKNKNNVKAKHILYIDQAFEDSIDLKTDEMKLNKISVFNKKMKIFFNNFKNKKIIIAGSDRRNNKKNIFNQKTFYNQTCKLVKNSNLVVGHNSTALQYAILFSKPILLLSSDELKSIPVIQENILNLKKILKCNYLELEHPNIKINYKINKKLYSKYIKDYIKEKIDNRNFFKIFVNNLFE